jgi:D-3-phosphoglycerate dehydrogenase
MQRHVLVTDYAWESLDVEREVLARVDASLVVAERGDEDELVALAPGVDAILTNWKPVTRRVLEAAPRCLVVARYGIGVDNIDVQAAGELGILVTNAPGFCADEVAEHVLGLVLALRRRIVSFAEQTRRGGWDNAAFGPLRRLRGQTLGIIGYGTLGRAVAGRAPALGMQVVALARAAPPGTDGVGVRLVPRLEEVLEAADVVTLHVPLNEGTRGLIGAAELARMRPGALLVNTARGAVVDSDALVEALRSGHIAGAGLDVLPAEPPARDDPLLAFEQVIVTPHAAFYSLESSAEVARRAASSVAEVLRGITPEHVVDRAVLRAPALRASS